MNSEYLSSSFWGSLLTIALSLFVVVIFGLFVNSKRLYSSLIMNSRIISAVLICATLLLLPILLLSTHETWLPAIVLTKYVRNLITAVLFVAIVFLLLKAQGNHQKRTDQALLVNIRELDIRKFFIIDPQVPLKITLTHEEKNILLRGFTDKNPMTNLDDNQLANLARLLLLAQSGNEMPFESLLYLAETIIESPTCASELPGELLILLYKHSSRIKKSYLEDIKNKILPIISRSLSLMDIDSAKRVISGLDLYGIQIYVELPTYSGSPNISTQEEYEKSKDLTYFFYDLSTTDKYPINTVEFFKDSVVENIKSSAKLLISNGSLNFNF